MATITTQPSDQAAIKVPPKWLMKPANSILSLILHSPLHKMLSYRMMLITFTGRKSGKSYTTPVTLERDGDSAYFFSHSSWANNLKGGAPVTLLIAGKNVTGRGETIADADQVLAATKKYIAKHGPKAARFIAMQLDPDRAPTPEELATASEGRVLIVVKLSTNLTSYAAYSIVLHLASG